MNLLREYIREILAESKLSGRTIKGVLNLLDGYADNTWIFFDTETTGMHPKNSQITEVGAVAVNPNEWASDASILGEFNEKIKLEQETLNKIEQERDHGVEDGGARKKMSVTDILSMTRYGETKGKYSGEAEVLDRFLEWMQTFSNPLLVAQNARFDMKFINVRSGGKVPKYPVLDTQELMKNYLVPLLKTQTQAEEGDLAAQELLDKLYINRGNWGYHSVSMGVVSKAYGIDVEGWHNALVDVKMMMEMYKSVVDTIRQGLEVDISAEQGKDLAKQKKRQKRKKRR